MAHSDPPEHREKRSLGLRTLNQRAFDEQMIADTANQLRCLGALLALLEGGIAIGIFLDRFGEIEPDAERSDLTHIPGPHFRAPKRVVPSLYAPHHRHSRRALIRR